MSFGFGKENVNVSGICKYFCSYGRILILVEWYIFNVRLIKIFKVFMFYM